MARYIGPVCRLCRRDGTKLFLKGARCFSEKCAIDRRGYPPGQHGQGRPRHSEYSLQLREKQKLKRIYGILETQFRHYFRKAEKKKGITGENLLRFLERRLDNVVYRLGFVLSRKQARMLIRQDHFLVNGHKVSIASYLVEEGDVVEVKESSRQMIPIETALSALDLRRVPSWLEIQREQFKGIVKAYPTKEDIAIPVNEQLVVELYSR